MNKTITVTKELAIRTMNFWGSEGRPFLFVIDFLQNEPIVLALDEINEQQFLFKTPLLSNVNPCSSGLPIEIEAFPMPKEEYEGQFKKVLAEIRRGNSFVVNLTCQTPIKCNTSTHHIFHASKSKYGLWYKDHFVCFSPETFVQIEDGCIKTFPMKGTIDANKPNAAEDILNDEKEKAEHNCVVDLLRNDLSMIAENVEVTRYRYIDKVLTEKGALLQVSSEITGILNADYKNHLGDIIFSMLPAGSITGAPKIKTTEIILDAENYDRGYYSGVFGVFDGHKLDSAVMIRFIEETAQGLVFKSGGGITAKSNLDNEYNEMNAKVYVSAT
ncbi:aminodeoxychorismate synthase component I [Paludibacter jiangxiensis]|uniref:Para-aminobenzoate synthetase component 1 n=1 Tax=Paludibacter jiangxiensis TaxID=681398 RepID=A0A161LWV0_9BACT|nr:aminodeoxychorismate synthase component I [Paludibacter jiangxiensis]GAT63772.1 para-aminobenzoate synthetase component 1 [Paludibacter jiangxiensis]